jgi:hypothetical protein
LVKYILAAILAIFADAAIAHSILWGNDPSSPEWLDFERTGLQTCLFIVYFLGYLVVLWLWDQRLTVGITQATQLPYSCQCQYNDSR